MTNKNKTQKTTDNKALFGPLGKYAIIAVIMVSIIITTTIMLNKQLNNVGQELAILEQEVIDTRTAESVTTDTQAEKETTTVSVEDSIPAVETETTEATNEAIIQKVAEIEQTEQLSSTESVEIEAATSEAVESEIVESEMVESEMVADNSKPVKTIGSQRNMENKARLATNKQEQKQRLSNQFARINKRELQQLEQYKINQDKRIARLRKQNTQQGHIIDALIVRNQELATIRKVNIQKHQTNREQILNRI